MGAGILDDDPFTSRQIHRGNGSFGDHSYNLGANYALSKNWEYGIGQVNYIEQGIGQNYPTDLNKLETDSKNKDTIIP